MDSLTGYSK